MYYWKTKIFISVTEFSNTDGNNLKLKKGSLLEKNFPYKMSYLNFTFDELDTRSGKYYLGF